MSAERPVQVGDRAHVKCSDSRLRLAVCEDDRGVLVWRFADGKARRVDASTAVVIR